MNISHNFCYSIIFVRGDTMKTDLGVVGVVYAICALFYT